MKNLFTKLFVLLVGLSIVAFGNSPEQDIEIYKPKVEPVLKKIEAIPDLIAKLDTKGLNEPNLKLDFEAGDYNEYNKNRNVIMLHEERLQNITKFQYVEHSITDNSLIFHNASLVRNGDLTGTLVEKSDHIVENYFEQFLLLKYVLFVRLKQFQQPEMINDTEFNPGYLKYMAFLVELEGSSVLGSFEFEANNGSELSSFTSDLNARLLGDLRAEARIAFSDSLKKCVKELNFNNRY